MRKIMMAAIAWFSFALCGCGGGSAGGTALTPASYTVSFSAGAHGTLAGATSQTVTAGAATSAVSAVPATGYHLVNWTGDNGFVASTGNPLTVTNVSANLNITANFALNPSSAVLKLFSAGSLPLGISLSGINVKVQLPAGVSVGTDANHTVNAGVVTASGVAAAASGVTIVGYTPATATASGTLEFLVVSYAAGGFGVGEFATVNCLIASGSLPTPGDFILPATGFRPADLQLLPVAGLTASLTASIQ